MWQIPLIRCSGCTGTSIADIHTEMHRHREREKSRRREGSQERSCISSQLPAQHQPHDYCQRRCTLAHTHTGWTPAKIIKQMCIEQEAGICLSFSFRRETRRTPCEFTRHILSLSLASSANPGVNEVHSSLSSHPPFPSLSRCLICPQRSARDRILHKIEAKGESEIQL